MTQVRLILETLGLSGYSDRLLAEGFDTWEILTDITESDLNDLGVKLGHRRKLQRAIAEHRRQHDIPQSSVTPTATMDDTLSVTDETPTAAQLVKVRTNETTEDCGVRTKRKYRRHPKPDSHAPERPPSAYVLFSNYMRDVLKSKDHSFTEMAKIVGEKWQELPASDRERFERQASGAKERYLDELSRYKKTDKYAQYMQYLADFKAKNNNNTEGKRTKIQRHSPSHSSRGSPDQMPTSRQRFSSGSLDSRDNSPHEDIVTINGIESHANGTDHKSSNGGISPKTRTFPFHSSSGFGNSGTQSSSDISTQTNILDPSGRGAPISDPYYASRSPTPANPYLNGTTSALARGSSDLNSASAPKPTLLPPQTMNQRTPKGSLQAIMDVSPRARRILPAPVPCQFSPRQRHALDVTGTVRGTPSLSTSRSHPGVDRPLASSRPHTSLPAPDKTSMLTDGNERCVSSSFAALLRAGEELLAKDDGYKSSFVT